MDSKSILMVSVKLPEQTVSVLTVKRELFVPAWIIQESINRRSAVSMKVLVLIAAHFG